MSDLKVALITAGGSGIVSGAARNDDRDRTCSHDFVETRLGGASTWEVNFPAPSQLNKEYLDRVRALAEDLQQVNPPDKTQLTKVISITDTLDFVPSKPFASDPIQSKLDQIEDLPELRLPAAQSLLYTVLLAEAFAPQGDAQAGNELALARVRKLSLFECPC